MKKYILLIVSICFIAASCHFNFDRNHNGEVKSFEQRNISGFTGIEVEDAIEVELTTNSSESVEIGCSNPKKISEVITEVKNGVLKIYINHSFFKPSSDFSVVAKISTNQIESIKTSGASSVTFVKPATTNSLKLQASGASSITGNINTNAMKADITGASTLNLNGNSKILTIDASGASNINAKKCTVEKCAVDISGASTAKIYASKEITGTLSGASNLQYAGNAANVNVTTSQASSMSKD